MHILAKRENEDFMSNKKKEKVVPVEAEKPTEPKSHSFYPDIEFNKRERRRSIVLSGILLFFLAGMGISIIATSIQNQSDPMGWISGLLLLILFVMVVAMIPGAFKQYPVKKEPIVIVKAKEVTVHGVTYRYQDIKEVRLTITLESVGNKVENEKFLDSILDKEPPKNITANLDFAVPGKKGKIETVYTTIENAYEALLAIFQAGYKHYTIVYSLKKLAKKSTYNLNSSKTEDGKTLASLSKKERLKQLF